MIKRLNRRISLFKLEFLGRNRAEESENRQNLQNSKGQKPAIDPFNKSTIYSFRLLTTHSALQIVI